MERKEAIEVIKKNWPDSSFTMLREALESLIPELAESEDEKIRKWLIHYFKEVCDNVSEKEKKGIVAWLEKQPKDSPVLTNSSNTGKVEQKPWSEEDKENLDRIITIIHCYTGTVEEEIKLTNWLKSLKARYTWKPSDEQMDALHYVTNFDYGGHKATLVSLYEQLKKL